MRLELASPGWVAGAAVVLLGLLAAARLRRKDAAIRGDLALWPRFTLTWRQRLARAWWPLELGALALLAASLVQPRLVERHVLRERVARSLVVLLDVSSSMAVEAEPSVPRLELARAVLTDLLEGREGDRVALVAFAGEPVLECPLTSDLDLVTGWLEELEPVASGAAADRTAIGVALARAAVLAGAVPAESRRVLLLTDGENNVERIQPWQGARLLAEAGARVDVVALGRAQDDDLLARIAAATGGERVVATDRASLEAALVRLERDEPVRFLERETSQERALARLLWLPASLVLMLGYALRRLVWVRWP